MKLLAALVALAALLSTESRAGVFWEYSGLVSSPEPRTTKAAACLDAMADSEVASLVNETEGNYLYPAATTPTGNFLCRVFDSSGEPLYNVGSLAISCTSPHTQVGYFCHVGGEPDPGTPDPPPGPPDEGDEYCGSGRQILAEDGEDSSYQAFCSAETSAQVSGCVTMGIGSWATVIATNITTWPAAGQWPASPYFQYNGCTFVIPHGKCGPSLNGQKMCFGRNTGTHFNIGGQTIPLADILNTGQGPAGRDMPLQLRNIVQHPASGMIDPGTQVQASQRATVEVPVDMLMGAYDTETIGASLGTDTLNDHVDADWQNQTVNNYYHPGDYDTEDGAITNYFSRDWGNTPFNPVKVWSNNDYNPAHDMAVLSVVNPETGAVEPYVPETHTSAIIPPGMVGSGTGGTGGGTTGGDTTTPVDLGPGPESYYERRYPDGIAGVIATRRAELAATPLAMLASGIVLPEGEGEYPSWELSFQFFGDKVDLGTHTVSLPEPLWLALRALILIGAFVFAIRLIFGGGR